MGWRGILGFEYGIVQAPLGPDISGPELVAAVANAGGLGLLRAPDWVRFFSLFFSLLFSLNSCCLFFFCPFYACNLDECWPVDFFLIVRKKTPI